jgi:hypothetical protein
MAGLIRPLPQGPVDIVGDVHGEVEVLASLLDVLGYDEMGRHPASRTLVFVGDLIDRGPASLAVVDLVRALVVAERAWCVLGNHELNVLRDDPKDGSEWFFAGLGDAERARVLDFLATLPLALEREDLRVVHACWEDTHVARLRGASGPVVPLAKELSREIDARHEREGLREAAKREEDVPLGDRSSEPPMLPALAAWNVRRQVEHPVKVLTSGIEAVAPQPFWAGGKWRFEQRVPWWQTYAGPMTVVGHYWRAPNARAYQGKGPDLFDGVAPTARLGPRRNVMCVDYSIGKRSAERERGGPFDTALAAFRWPEGELAFAE